MLLLQPQHQELLQPVLLLVLPMLVVVAVPLLLLVLPTLLLTVGRLAEQRDPATAP